jgi:hypothetical protein
MASPKDLILPQHSNRYCVMLFKSGGSSYPSLQGSVTATFSCASHLNVLPLLSCLMDSIKITLLLDSTNGKILHGSRRQGCRGNPRGVQEVC